MMKNNRSAIFAWTLFGLIAVTYAGALIFYLSTHASGFTISTVALPQIPAFFAFVGALILSRQPRNVIGWLMMLPGFSIFLVVDVYLEPYILGHIPPPAAPSSLLLLALWFSNWNWFLLVLPIMFIMVLFPTGRAIGPRWKWLIYMGFGIVIVFILLITFASDLAPGATPESFRVPNPIGFLQPETIDAIVAPLLFLFPAWIVLCAASLFVRFRRARAVERQQIKWLLYAGIIFVLLYMPSFIGDTYSQAENIWNLLFPIGMATFPVAIGIAILRHRLFDIDIIIRRTLQYAILTAILALVYFGGVVLLQNLFGALAGQADLPLITVISTLAIAALFSPLRIRIQAFIDRRFYRQKYDSEQTLARFSTAARDEVDLNNLSAALLGAVGETLQPEAASLWLKEQPE